MRNMLLALFICFAASAQERGVVVHKQPGEAVMSLQAVELNTAELQVPPKVEFTGGQFEYVSTVTHLETRVVKNVPYSAEAVNESVQILGDGNRITRKNTVAIYRDSQGRTRREQTLESIGPFSAAGEAPQIVSISDPVAQVSWTLEPGKKIARKSATFNLRVGVPGGGGGVPGGGAPGGVIAGVVGTGDGKRDMELRIVEEMRARGGERVEYSTGARVQGRRERPPTKTDSLGTQNIEGVQAQGTRTTMTIPAGEIGNERPIEIVSEQWYSPDLQVTVMSKRIDPRFGETTYTLTRINRTEPAASLFQVPPDYTVQEGPKVEYRRGPAESRPAAK